MELPEHIEKKINVMKPSEKKEAWVQLKETDNFYIATPPIDTINCNYKSIMHFIDKKTLPALKLSSNFYHKVDNIYQNYDYILHKDYFDSTIHSNEYDAVYVTNKTRQNINNICTKIDERINKLEKNYS